MTHQSAEIRGLQAEPVADLVDGRAVVGGLGGIDHTSARIDAAIVAVDVAADAVVAVIAVIQVATQQQVFIDEVTALQRQQAKLVVVLVRIGIRLTRIAGKRYRQRLRAFQGVVGEGQAEVEIGVAGLVADLAKELRHTAGIMVGPAAVAQHVPGEKIIPFATLATMLELHRAAAERAGSGLDRAARIVAAALGIDRQCAAQSIQAKSRIRAGNQLDAGDRRLRNQVPVDDIAKGLVDAHPILEHRQALRHTQ